jgi:F0F1-type ATP synthase delta subunit
MWQRIEKEKRAAEHLLYVSMKYTKTCDVMLNLILRWQAMLDECINALLERTKKKKLVSSIPTAPRAKVNILYEVFKKEKDVKEALDLYMFFKRIPQLEQIREAEFRKGVALKVIDSNKLTVINLDKLKEWEDLLERFLSFVRHYIS